MHTLMVIVGGFLLLGFGLLIARLTGGAVPGVAAKAALVFIPVWLAAAALNMWVGAQIAGHPINEELPIFLLVFLIPAAAATAIWWKSRRTRGA
jgi:hypothetical protein